jgi:hypothetical protein
MQRDLCPHCGQYGIKAVRKLMMGPMFSISCTACGGRVGVPFRSMLALVPAFLALMIVFLIEDSSLSSFWLGALGTLGMVYLWYGFVPLIKRG